MSRIFRGVFIVWVVLRHGLDELVLSSFQHPWIRLLARILSVGATWTLRADSVCARRWSAWARFL